MTGWPFPFVYLALHVAAGGMDLAVWAGWVLWDVLYRIVIGAALGAGRLGSRTDSLCIPDLEPLSLNRTRRARPRRRSPVLRPRRACRGLRISFFVAGVVVRRAESKHKYHQRLHGFSDAVENAMTAILLVLLGGVMPALWPHLVWQHAIVGFGLILVIRPLAGVVGLLGTNYSFRERALIAFYGVRGIGSIYYLGYAATHIEFIDEAPLWALVSFTICFDHLTRPHGT